VGEVLREGDRFGTLTHQRVEPAQCSDVATGDLNKLFHTLPIRPRLGSPVSISLAGKPRLQVGQSDIIRPSVAADGCPMATPEVLAIDQETAHDSAHICQGDFCGRVTSIPPFKRGKGGQAIAHAPQPDIIRRYKLSFVESQTSADITCKFRG
jgi:hypothetical protein